MSTPILLEQSRNVLRHRRWENVPLGMPQPGAGGCGKLAAWRPCLSPAMLCLVDFSCGPVGRRTPTPASPPPLPPRRREQTGTKPHHSGSQPAVQALARIAHPIAPKQAISHARHNSESLCPGSAVPQMGNSRPASGRWSPAVGPRQIRSSFACGARASKMASWGPPGDNTRPPGLKVPVRPWPGIRRFEQRPQVVSQRRAGRPTR